MAATTSILPVDTIEFEILPRLPVKSLLRFKSVCKSWNSLISSDVFIKSVRNSDHDSVTLVSHSGQDNLYGHFTAVCIGCINGLVFIEEHQWDCDSETLEFIIWNPATKQCLEIRPPPVPISCRYFLGFGFDSVANDYKFMYVINIKEHPLVGYIYSCNSGCWTKIIQSNFVVPGCILNMDPVIINGSPFWLILQDLNGSHLHVMSFDVRQEFFRLLPDLGSSGPITIEEDGECCQLLNFRDSPAVVIYNLIFCFDETIDIHVFNEKCENWSKMSFKPFKFLSEVPTSCMQLRFVLGLSNGDILLVDSEVRKLYWVNLGNYTIKSLREGGDLCYGHKYSESLVFINGMKPLYQKEDLFQFLSIKKNHGPAREEIQINRSFK
ncbi:F-box domain-containing protein [Heracleum sosnowskyi]|uniref:F-box domain-containing protein n=1 Tax=Heracleum sosnowskyi TaxID=360622 RepID=A0AAD8MS45_9APIA|nr:F-box domain-containing protein [Heracleum sosnowskyi]